jgi:hypothetical protein
LGKQRTRTPAVLDVRATTNRNWEKPSMPAFAAVRGLRERHRNDPIDHRRVEGEGTGLLPSSKGQDCPGLRARAADGLALRPNREPQCLALPPPRHRKRAGARMHAWPRVAEFADAGLAAPILSIARMSLRYGARVDRPPPVVVAARPWGGTGPGARRPDPYRLLGLSQADSSVPLRGPWWSDRMLASTPTHNARDERP